MPTIDRPDPSEYGAYYRTGYLHNVESHYGRQDLLGKLSP